MTTCDNTSNIALSTENVAVHFGGLVAISDMSFTAKEGEVTSLIGPNGAGKTTAFNVITGFLEPTMGTIRYRGELLNDRKPHEIAELGVVRTFQKTSVFGGCTVFDNILIGLHRQGKASPLQIVFGLGSVKKEERLLREQAKGILEFSSLLNRAEEMASDLPYGEQRLLEVAVALATNPTLLLLDEPVSGMNPSETESFMEMVAKIKARGTTILLVEHDMRMVMGVSDHIVVLNQGGIIAKGTPKEIQNHPEVLRAYLGRGGDKNA